MKGYWNKPAETAEALRDGWLHTGDLARVDSDGYLTLVVITGAIPRNPSGKILKHKLREAVAQQQATAS